MDLVGYPCLVLLLTPLLLVAAPFLLWRLRSLEQSDPDIDRRPDQALIKKLSSIEDLRGLFPEGRGGVSHRGAES